MFRVECILGTVQNCTETKQLFRSGFANRIAPVITDSSIDQQPTGEIMRTEHVDPIENEDSAGYSDMSGDIAFASLVILVATAVGMMVWLIRSEGMLLWVR